LSYIGRGIFRFFAGSLLLLGLGLFAYSTYKILTDGNKSKMPYSQHDNKNNPYPDSL